MCRWRPLVLATGFCGLVAWGASAQTLTEEQALTRMRMEHPQMRVLRFTVREVEAAARERALNRSRLAIGGVGDITAEELGPLLDRLLGEKVRLKLEHGENLGLVRVDERQFEQVVMNLVQNALDAVDGGAAPEVRIDLAVQGGRHIALGGARGSVMNADVFVLTP
mgnify:CR=1 FL=1